MRADTKAQVFHAMRQRCVEQARTVTCIKTKGGYHPSGCHTCEAFLERHKIRLKPNAAATPRSKSRGARGRRRRPSSPPSKLLTFELCGGFTNQRIALIHGLMIALASNRTAVLPLANLNGEQDAELGYAELKRREVPLETFYDIPATTKALRRLGIRTRVDPPLAQQQRGARSTAASRRARPLSWYRDHAWPRTPLMALDCPLFAIKPLPPARPAPITQCDVRVQGACRYNGSSPGGRGWFDAADYDVVPANLAAAGCSEDLRRTWYGRCGMDGVSVDVRFTSAAQRPTLDRTLALFWKVDAALIFAEPIRRARAAVRLALRGRFSALHLRAEADWSAHCAAAQAENCMRNTKQLQHVLRLELVPTYRPLYVASGLSPARVGERFGGLAATYSLLFKEQLLPPALLRPAGLATNESAAPREYLAAIDFAVCSTAEVFVGNSVSSFTALLLLTPIETRNARRRFHYNGGNVPLAAVLGAQPPRRPGTGDDGPRLKKWVFATSAESTREYDELTRVAVRSAQQVTSLLPVCIFLGEPRASPLARWLEAEGVVVLAHTPRWLGRLRRAMPAARQWAGKSPSYLSFARLAATFLRVDLPILGFLDEFVLYADVDVIFLRQPLLSSFGTSPRYITVGPESSRDTADDIDRCRLQAALAGTATPDGACPKLTRLSRSLRQNTNVGVMLINVDSMLGVHAEFVEWVFQEKHIEEGLDFGGFGPADQGAFNAFFADKLARVARPAFNHKPYWGRDAQASILHFHGPKPWDYLRSHEDAAAAFNGSFGTTTPTSYISQLVARCEALGETCLSYSRAWMRLAHDLPPLEPVPPPPSGDLRIVTCTLPLVMPRLPEGRDHIAQQPRATARGGGGAMPEALRCMDVYRREWGKHVAAHATQCTPADASALWELGRRRDGIFPVCVELTARDEEDAAPPPPAVVALRPGSESLELLSTRTLNRALLSTGVLAQPARPPRRSKAVIIA